jgi:hypothetical protein
MAYSCTKKKNKTTPSTVDIIIISQSDSNIKQLNHLLQNDTVSKLLGKFTLNFCASIKYTK